MDERVETPKEFSKRVGVSDYHIRSLIRTGELEHIQICGRIFIPSSAWPRYLEANTKGGKRWEDEARVQTQVASLWSSLLHLLDRRRSQSRAQHGHEQYRRGSRGLRRVACHP